MALEGFFFPCLVRGHPQFTPEHPGVLGAFLAADRCPGHPASLLDQCLAQGASYFLRCGVQHLPATR